MIARRVGSIATPEDLLRYIDFDTKREEERQNSTLAERDPELAATMASFSPPMLQSAEDFARDQETHERLSGHGSPWHD